MRKQYHSRAYHKYFEGYAEEQTVQPDGRIRIDRVYIGNYYRQDIMDRQRLERRVLYAGLYLFALALFIHAGTRNTSMNVVWYVSAPIALSLLALFWMLVPMCYYITARREMVIRVYRESSKRLIEATFVTAIALALTALCAFIHLMITPPGELGPSLFYAGGYIVGGGSILGIHLLERRLPYIALPAKNARTESSTIISP
jgi:hypothetical protein